MPIVDTPIQVAKNEGLLIASGDLRQSANKVAGLLGRRLKTS